MVDDGESGGRRHRKMPRLPGPFEGRRLGALTVDLTVHDLSAGGCLIQSFHDVPVGRRMKIELDLPEEGLVVLNAESVNTRPDYGFAVKFVDVSEETRQLLERVIGRLLGQAKLDV